MGGFLSWFVGGLDGLVKILVVMVIVDQITGVIKAGVTHKWSSEAGFHGIAKKVLMFVIVGIANIIDNEMLGHSEVLRDAVSLFYVANEGLSIIENAIESGLPIPEGLKERFMTWHSKSLISKNEPGPEDAD